MLASASTLTSTRIISATLLRSDISLVTVINFAAHDLAVERQCLEHDVEAALVLVREHEPDVEPVIILAVAE